MGNHGKDQPEAMREFSPILLNHDLNNPNPNSVHNQYEISASETVPLNALDIISQLLGLLFSKLSLIDADLGNLKKQNIKFLIMVK